VDRLVPIGGHNLLEPALAGLPVLFGPYIANQHPAGNQLLDLPAWASKFLTPTTLSRLSQTFSLMPRSRIVQVDRCGST